MLLGYVEQASYVEIVDEKELSLPILRKDILGTWEYFPCDNGIGEPAKNRLSDPKLATRDRL
jgi:hypothetical protein